jgi:uncharacterized BrkB/YihY/UPF0761 family membrane protein
VVIALVIAATVLTGQRYGDLFDSMNVELPYLTGLVIHGGRFLWDQWYVALPFLAGTTIVLTWPLRSVPREKRGKVVAITLGSLVVAIVLMAFVVWLPSVKLQQALGR